MMKCNPLKRFVAPLFPPTGVTRKANGSAGFTHCYSCYPHNLMNVFKYREGEARLGFNREKRVTTGNRVTSPVVMVPACHIQKRECST